MRLVTRGDLDGLTCAVIISSHVEIEDILLIHPQDITDKRVEITKNDILANIPYHPNCALWFDHHLKTGNNPEPPPYYQGVYAQAPSAAGLAYSYYGGKRTMPQFEELVRQTDRLDSADLEPEDVTNPQGYIRLGYTIDSRTGLGSFKEYFLHLMKLLKTESIETILADTEVDRRWRKMVASEVEFKRALQIHSRMEGRAVVTDFRALSDLPIGNRFLIYALFPDANVSLRLHWGPQRSFVVAAMGHSIFDHSCRVNIGELCSKYGGGGHMGAGTCPLPPEQADQKISEILELLRGK